MEEDKIAPDTLSADFTEWDSQPDTLPSDFNFDKEVEPAEESLSKPAQELRDEFESVYSPETQDLLEYSGRGFIEPAIGMIESVAKWTGNEDFADEMANAIDNNKERVADLAKKLGFTKDDFTNPHQVSKIAGEFMPLAWVRRLKTAVAGETIIGYASAKGGGADEGESLAAGALQGAFTFAGGQVSNYAMQALKGETALWKNLVSGKASEKQAYDFVVKQSGATDKEILIYNKAYSKATGKQVADFTEADKINAVMNNSEVASKFKVQAELYSESVSGNLKQIDETMRDVIKDSTKGGDFDIPILQFKEYAQQSGSMYGEVKDILIDNFNFPVRVSSDIVNGIKDSIKGSSMTIDDTVVTKRILNNLENADDLDVAKLLEMKQDLNSLNLKSTKAFKAGEIGKSIDSEIQKAIGDEGFSVWRDVNKRYAAKMMLEQDNPIASIFTQALDKTASFSAKQIADKMLSLPKAGYNTFDSMRQVLGEEVMTKVEKEIVNTGLKEKGGLYKLLERMEGFEFSTTEGRSILSELNRIKGAVPVDDVKKVMSNIVGSKTSSVGWSDNIVNKARFAVIGRLWDTITRRLPSASNERALLTLGDTLKEARSEISMNIKTDKQLQKVFLDEQNRLKVSILKLKEKGKARTKEDNRQLAIDIAQEKQIYPTVAKIKGKK